MKNFHRVVCPVYKSSCLGLGFLVLPHHLLRICRHQGARCWGVLALEMITHLYPIISDSNVSQQWAVPHTSAIVTHLTPSCLLICSIMRSCISKTCGRPDTSGWMVMGKMNSSDIIKVLVDISHGTK